ncbi:hypothetical protein [uncultured Friedmanniella sp.]|uniref:hypothetical protein n=1 Tax=uncultured Friedmanniella sp. TaxID=335381 RepID=UPI0035CAE683
MTLSLPSAPAQVAGPPATRLPRRPVLTPAVPVLQRGPAVLQVGLEPTAVVVRHRAAATLLGALDGRHDLSALRRLAAGSGMAPAEVDVVLRALHEAGLLAPPTSATGTAVRLVGLGPLGQQVARLLLAAGLRVYAADDRPGPTRRRALRITDLDDLPRLRSGGLTVVNHWSKPERVDLSLTVVATDAVEPDRLVTDALLRGDQPHLVLRAAGRSATVGPLVLPGRTACLRCTDLTRRDADPDWPVLLGQLVALRLPTAAALVAWAAGVGVAQVLAHLQGQLPESAGATVELSEHDHLMRWRAWPVHAGCGCAWAATTEWGP